MSEDGYVKIAIMGATGTGKSTFIRHLTQDAKIHIGHDTESETSDVQTSYYTDEKTGRPVMLIDTPGFDDSRPGMTDTDILQKILDFLQPENNEGKKLNGIIYMHRISDPRVGGLARKNLRMFQALCGEKSLRNVRIVTTNWDRVTKQEGPQREESLRSGPFQSLLASGARMCRHHNNVDSAQEIIAELIPLKAVSTQIQDQVADGKPLGETDAGRIINDDIEELKRKHEADLANLREEMEEAALARDEELRAELDAERQALEEKVMRAEEDQARLQLTLEEVREQQSNERELLDQLRSTFAEEASKLEKERKQAQEEVRRLKTQIELAENQRQKDLADKQQRRTAKNAMIRRREEEEASRRQQEMERLAADAERRNSMLQQQIMAIEAQKRKAENYANRGMFGRFLHDVGSVTDGWAEEGSNIAGPLGGLVAGIIGLGVSPLVAAKRAVVGK